MIVPKSSWYNDAEEPEGRVKKTLVSWSRMEVPVLRSEHEKRTISLLAPLRGALSWYEPGAEEVACLDHDLASKLNT